MSINRTPSFLLLRFLCRYKENDVAVGQSRRFFFSLGYKSQQKEQPIKDLLLSDDKKEY
jgi:hypothetical protein